MPVMIYPKKQGKQLNVYFTSTEFDCPCAVCKATMIDPALSAKLAEIREALGKPLRINSGYRCPAYQADLKFRGYETAKGISQHELGRAADIMSEGVGGLELEKIARAAGIKAVGVGGTWIHIDLRDDKERRWEYTKR